MARRGDREDREDREGGDDGTNGTIGTIGKIGNLEKSITNILKFPNLTKFTNQPPKSAH